MSQRSGFPKSVTVGNAKGALSGDVKVEEGERVYVAEGDLIAGKYRVERILGVGGVGFVVATRHTDLGGHFALKFLKKRFLNDKAIVERFTREARAACRIKSDYVARVYDVGAHGRAPFIVMEHLVGRDLAAVVAERGAFAISDAVEYSVQACAALAVAHASGIVHRDIKPENLFLVDEEGLPAIKLLDFGISKIALASERPTDEWGAEGEPITGTSICGTPFYMSPEQIRSTASVDARSDLWSLGMVLYELLTATTAFQAEAVMDVCTAILDEEPRRVNDLRPEVPPGLADVVARCLQKNPANRFANVAELAVALLPFAPPRALAIAEGSAWIRRAAIHTLGSTGSVAGHHPASGPGDARVSSGYPAPVNPSSASLARPSPTPAQSSSQSLPGRAHAGRWIALAAAASLVVGSIAALGAAHLFRNHNGDEAAPKPSTATTSAMTEPGLAAPQPPATAALPDEPQAPSGASHPPPVASPVASPVSVAAPPVHAWAPPRPRAAPPHAQPSAKPALSSSSTSTEPSSASPAAIAPPVPRGRPDLGY